MSEADVSYLNHLRELFESSDENLQEKIYDFFPGIIYVYSTDTGKLRYINKKVTDVLGFSYDDIKTWDHEFSKFIFKDDVELVCRELEKFKALKDEESHSYQCRFNKKTGDWIHFNVIGKVLRRDESGKAASLLFVAQDINDQIRSHEELRAIRELAEDNEELLQFGNWNWNPKTNIILWSRGMYILMDFPETEKREITLDFYLNHVVDGDRDTLTTVFEQVIKRKDKIIEFQYTVKSNLQKEKVFASKGKIIYDERGEVRNVVGITRDITEQTQLYNNLSNYKQMVMQKEDFLGQGSWEWDLLDNTLTWSDGMYRLYGYDPAIEKEHIALNEKFFNRHLLKETIESGNRNIAERLKSGISNYVWQYQIKGKDGETKMMDSFGRIFRDRNGKGIKVYGTTRDVTQLKKYENDLEQKIVELDRSNRELEDFAYAASHDLQEPLRKIATLGDRLQSKFGDALMDEGKKYVERIQMAIKSARFLIDSLMEFSRIAHDHLTFAEISLDTVLQEVISDLELKVEETQTTFRIANLPTLEISAGQIKQLFSNLILNSIKFRRHNVPLEIDIQGRLVTRKEIENYRLNSQLTYFVITVKDNGIGFEEEYEQKIFQMFHRLHGKSEYPGAGIGLSLCKKITEQHKGLMYAKGISGEGAIFTIILPEKHI